MLTSNGYVLDESPTRLGRLAPVPAADRSDRDALWNRLRRDGYLYLPGFLDPATVLDFRRFYFSRLDGTGLVRTGTDPLWGIAGDGEPDRAKLRHALFSDLVPSDEYAAFCTQPAIRDWFAWFLADDVHLHRRKILRHTRPGEAGIGTATQAHYDLVYLREGTDRVLSIWIPLGDTPERLGGLTYLEGSHHVTLAEEREGRLKRPAASITADLPSLADAHDTRWLTTDYRAGDVVVHSAYIVHAALDNVDDAGHMRLSTDIRYQAASDPIDWRWQNHWHADDGL
ncbi:phytanoyl-CoA dioxygenase family protein [Beutenbergia cavernae]|uniref:phytanoyl-CoA dioxygenase family protein n=1 Tax=Beutenbergia cavernae TaxID=84757 RepID=UPI0005BE96AF|nr:phytanoyl-CoA dioxygenase family protein [Beutenbergia cavernae]